MLDNYTPTDLFRMRLHYEDGFTKLHGSAAAQYNELPPIHRTTEGGFIIDSKEQISQLWNSQFL
ncbi:MAG: hypothetical protein AAFN93_30120, partial [Bacteroidota bacterium]